MEQAYNTASIRLISNSQQLFHTTSVDDIVINLKSYKT